MKSTKSKAVRRPDGEFIVTNGRTWTKEQREHYLKYQQEYHSKNYRRFYFRIQTSDTEMIEWLADQENLTDYIRTLIKKDMDRQKKKKKR